MGDIRHTHKDISPQLIGENWHLRSVAFDEKEAQWAFELISSRKGDGYGRKILSTLND